MQVLPCDIRLAPIGIIRDEMLWEIYMVRSSNSVIQSNCYLFLLIVLVIAFLLSGCKSGSDDLGAYPGNSARPIALDQSFGSAGIVMTNVSGQDQAFAVASQDDGKYVVSGYSDNGANVALARYNPDGSLDNGFGVGGIVKIAVGNGTQGHGRDIAILSNGKILVAGFSSVDVVLLKLNIDGSLDSSWGAGGVVTLSTAGNFKDEVYKMHVQSDGKVVLAGRTYNSNWDILLMRCNPDGSLDNSFGTNGVVTSDISSGNDNAMALTVQRDGKGLCCITRV